MKGYKKGFSLMEIIVVLIIVGIAAASTLPNLISSSERSKAQVATTNLLAIAAAQAKFNEDYSSYCSSHTPAISPCYCISTGTNPTGKTLLCADSTGDLYTNLGLNVSDSFTYSCSATGGSIPYKCTATDGTDTLTLDPNTASSASPVTCGGPSGDCPS